MNADVDVHATRATGLGPTTQIHLFEQRLHLERHQPNVLPGDTRSRIEIDTQLIRMIEILRTHRVWMQLDTAKVHDPREPGSIVNHNLLRRTTRRKRQYRCAQPVGSIRWRALLIERL